MLNTFRKMNTDLRNGCGGQKRRGVIKEQREEGNLIQLLGSRSVPSAAFSEAGQGGEQGKV